MRHIRGLVAAAMTVLGVVTAAPAAAIPITGSMWTRVVRNLGRKMSGGAGSTLFSQCMLLEHQQ